MNLYLRQYSRKAFIFSLILTATLIFLVIDRMNVSAQEVLFELSGKVTDQSANPISGTTVDILEAGTTTIVTSDTTDANGDYSVSIVSAPYDVRVTPPTGSGFQVVIVQDWTVATANLTLDIVLVPIASEMVEVIGQIIDRENAPLSGNNIQFQTTQDGIPNVTAITDEDGRYSVQLVVGVEYRFLINNATSAVLPRPAYVQTNVGQPLVFSQDTTFNVQIPSARVNVHVQEPIGNPVAGVDINTNEVTGVFELTTSLGSIPASGPSRDDGITDADGNTTLWLFSSTDSYTIFAYPPINTPYLQTSIPNIIVTGDRSLVIAFQYFHAPPITSASVAPSNGNGKYVDPATATLSATAFAGYNIEFTYFKIDGGTIQTYNGPFNVSGIGVHTLEFWSIDNAGVIETPNSLVFEVQSNSPPEANDDSTTTEEEVRVTIDVLANDTDPDGDTLIINGVSDPPHGVAVIVDDMVEYTPDADYFGLDSFTYTIEDVHGESDTATVNITVSPINDPPIANNDGATVNKNSVNNPINVLANDSDPDGDTLWIILVSDPAHGTAVIVGNMVEYTPDPGYSGTDSFAYAISDGQEADSAIVNITVNATTTQQLGNNGVGNGIDPQPPGNPPINDGPGTGPGNPGNRGGNGNGQQPPGNPGNSGNHIP